MAPILVPCLVALRAEYNAVAPGRDKRSDGWVGDQLHALRASDHNGDESGATPYEDADFVDEVHAIDVDHTGPWPAGMTFDQSVEIIRARHASGADDRLQNIIRNGRIASRSWGWSWRPYDGPNPHGEHAHFSARYTTAQENDTRPWFLGEIMLDQDIDKIVDAVAARLTAVDSTGTSLLGRTVWNHLELNADGARTFRVGGAARLEPSRADARRDAILTALAELGAKLPATPPAG